MRREDLEERLDTEVTVTLFDGSEYTGVLRQCGTDYVRAYKFEYNSLEEFLKRWKVEAVYHG
jgi:hypothetical protein